MKIKVGQDGIRSISFSIFEPFQIIVGICEFTITQYQQYYVQILLSVIRYAINSHENESYLERSHPNIFEFQLQTYKRIAAFNHNQPDLLPSTRFSQNLLKSHTCSIPLKNFPSSKSNQPTHTLPQSYDDRRGGGTVQGQTVASNFRCARARRMSAKS